jgi:serine/threonine protein kinase
VFEPLGKSLFEFIKGNKYYGFGLKQIQSIARQILEGVRFMHEEVGLTHTDLKPENILLKMDTKKPVTDQERWPIQVRRK